MDNTLRLAYEKIWGGMKGKILIVPSTFVAKEHKLVMGEACLYSIILMLPILKEIYDPNLISIDFGEDVLEEDYEEYNLILLGGPMTNKITEIFMSEEQRKKMRLRFHFADGTLLDSEDQSFHPQATIEHDHDYGVAIKRLNHPQKGRRLYILAGLRMFATQASTLLLTQPLSVQAISEKFKDGDFEICVERKSVSNPGRDPVGIEFPEALKHIVFPCAQSVEAKSIRNFANPPPPPPHTGEAIPFHLNVSSLFGLIAILGGFGLLVAGILANNPYCLIGGVGCVWIGTVHVLPKRTKRGMV